MSEVVLEASENQAHPDDATLFPINVFPNLPFGHKPGCQDVQTWFSLRYLQYIIFHPDLKLLQDSSVNFCPVSLKLIWC